MISIVERKIIVGYFFSNAHTFGKFKEKLWFFLFVWLNVNYVQLHRSWLNKVDVLTSPTSFSHEMGSINQENLIVGYFCSIAHPFSKFMEKFWIFSLFRQIWTMYNCKYHELK